MDQCHPAVLPHRTWRRNPVHWLHLPVPTGEHDSCLPKRPSQVYFSSGISTYMYFGLVKCIKVLPACELYHPVLPYHHGEKLTFPLCVKCLQDEMPEQPLERSYMCSHTGDKQVLVDTSCTLKLQEAMSVEYHINTSGTFPKHARGSEGERQGESKSLQNQPSNRIGMDSDTRGYSRLCGHLAQDQSRSQQLA